MCLSVAVEIGDGDGTHVKTHYDCGSPAVSDGWLQVVLTLQVV